MGHSVREVVCGRRFVQERDDLDDSGASIRIGVAESAEEA